MGRLHLILAVSALVLAGTSFGANFTNGSFETDLSSWLSYHVTTTQVAGTRTGGTGTKVANIVNTTPQGSFYQTGLDTQILTNGQPWRTRAWIRYTSAGTGSAGNFGFWGTNSPYTASTTNAVVPGTATAWTQYSVTHSWTSAAYTDGYCDIQFSFTAGAATDTVQMDDVELANVAGVSDWALF